MLYILYNQLLVKNSLHTRVIKDTHAWLKIMIAFVHFTHFLNI